MAYAAILTRSPRPAISQAPVVVPILAPMMMPIPAASVIISALTNEMVISDTRVLDCISVVAPVPKARLFQSLSVDRRRIDSSAPPVKALKPSSRHSMPNMKIATPAAIPIKSELAHSIQASSNMNVGKTSFLSMECLTSNTLHGCTGVMFRSDDCISNLQREGVLQCKGFSGQPDPPGKHFNALIQGLSQQLTITRINLIGRPSRSGTTVLHAEKQYGPMALRHYTHQGLQVLLAADSHRVGKGDDAIIWIIRPWPQGDVFHFNKSMRLLALSQRKIETAVTKGHFTLDTCQR